MLFVVTADEPLTYEVWRQGIMRPGLCDCEWLVLDNSRLRAGGQHFDSSGLPHRHNILEFIGSELVSLYRTLSYLLDNFASLFPESPVEDVSICFIEGSLDEVKPFVLDLADGFSKQGLWIPFLDVKKPPTDESFLFGSKSRTRDDEREFPMYGVRLPRLDLRQWLAAVIDVIASHPYSRLRECLLSSQPPDVAHWLLEVGSSRKLTYPHRRSSETARGPNDSVERLSVGWRVDAAMRCAVSSEYKNMMFDIGVTGATDVGAIPSPLSSDPAVVEEWLRQPEFAHDAYWTRYQRWLIRTRPDLMEAFPKHDGSDRSAFLRWFENRDFVEGFFPAGNSEEFTRANQPPGSHSKVGVNLVGYVTKSSSLGSVARLMLEQLDQSDVPRSVTRYLRSQSQDLDSDHRLYETTSQWVSRPATLAVINADQFNFVLADLPVVFKHTEYVVGYWAWELEQINKDWLGLSSCVNEIWCQSTFIVEAFERAGFPQLGTKVKYVPMPVRCPRPSAAERSDLGLPDGRFIFLTTFDFLSVVERKNPHDVIRAFTEAFPQSENGGPLLMVKSSNASHFEHEFDELRFLANGRDDIVFLNDRLSDDDQFRLIELADCLVSLHRSEGFGLPLAEAMFLGTNVIATNYSAPTDFLTDANSYLVPWDYCHPSIGQLVYDPEALWAQPSVIDCARLMRDVLNNPELATNKAVRASVDIEKYSQQAQKLLVRELRRIGNLESGGMEVGGIE